MSGDTTEALKKFRQKFELNFSLLSDTGHRTLEAYGVWQEKNLYGQKTMGIVRTTYILGPDSKVTHVFPRVKVDGHIPEILKSLKA